MIDFLPPDAVHAVKREYVIRAVSVWAFLLAAVAFIEVSLLFPTYVLLSQQLDALAAETAPFQNDASERAYKTARAALEQTQHLAKQLDGAYVRPTASEVLRAIQEAQTDSIALFGLRYEHTGVAVGTLEITGVARTREALVGFSAALERDPLFIKAEVPVADLARDRDLPFTLALTPAVP